MNGYLCFMDISLQLSMLYGYPFGYPWISMDIHVLTCYGFSIQGGILSIETEYVSSPTGVI